MCVSDEREREFDCRKLLRKMVSGIFLHGRRQLSVTEMAGLVSTICRGSSGMSSVSSKDKVSGVVERSFFTNSGTSKGGYSVKRYSEMTSGCWGKRWGGMG